VGGPSEKILVLAVDDDDGLRSIAADMLESLGAAALDAPNGREALRILRFNPQISLLFTDVRMPGLSGVELARQAREMRPDLRIVLCSAYVEDEAIWGFRLLQKPYRRADLAALLVPAPLGGDTPASSRWLSPKRKSR
jgi:CheY-like chemotaxis protein